MTNPYPFTKDVRRDQFADECKAAFGGALVTVRLSGGDALSATAGEVAHNGSITDAAIQAVIDAHVPQETNDQKIAKPAIAAIIAALEAGAATNAQVQAALAKVLRYIRRESI